MRKGDDVGDHITLMETKFARPAEKNDNVGKSMKLSAFISSFSDLDEYNAVSVSINNNKIQEATWKYVTMMFKEEQKRQRTRKSEVGKADNH